MPPRNTSLVRISEYGTDDNRCPALHRVTKFTNKESLNSSVPEHTLDNVKQKQINIHAKRRDGMSPSGGVVSCGIDRLNAKDDREDNNICSKILDQNPYLDLQTLQRSYKILCEGGWYYKDCTSNEAKQLLKKSSVGTFILRNSSDASHLFSLSVKTLRGATSVRIKYSNGLFQLDCEDMVKNRIPKFESVVELVDFHVTLSKDDSENHCRWLERSGRRDMSVTLTKPRLKTAPSLQHLCRLTINRSLTDLHFPERSSERLPLPKYLKQYLQFYPYKV